MKNIWERAVVLPLKTFLYPGSTFLDLGSNIGEVAASIVEGSEDVFVVAIEANPVLIPKIRECFKRCSVTNFEVYNSAAWSKSNESLILSVDESPYATSSSIYSTNVSSKTLFVESLAVDDVSQNWPRVSVIKVDVEGAEFEAIKGAAITIQRDYPVVTYERTAGKKDVDAFLRSLGYKLYLSNTLDIMTVHNTHDGRGVYNVLAVPPTISICVQKEILWIGAKSPKLHPGLYISHVEIGSEVECNNGVGVWNLNGNYWETAYVTKIESLAHYTNSTLLFDVTFSSSVEIRMTENCSHQHIKNCFTEKIDLTHNLNNPKEKNLLRLDFGKLRLWLRIHLKKSITRLIN